jgi:hypothetical protein
MLYDGWRHAAESVWRALSTIKNRLLSSNITLDALRALHNDRRCRRDCRELQRSTPGVGLFIDDTPAARPRKQHADARLTRHGITNSTQAERVRIEGVTPERSTVGFSIPKASPQPR